MAPISAAPRFLPHLPDAESEQQLGQVVLFGLLNGGQQAEKIEIKEGMAHGDEICPPDGRL